jgi:hypothetical protein
MSSNWNEPCSQDLSVSARSTRTAPSTTPFCYDGNQRPEVKRGHRVYTNDHWMVQPTQCILNTFNMQWITVPFSMTYMTAGSKQYSLCLQSLPCHMQLTQWMMTLHVWVSLTLLSDVQE